MTKVKFSALVSEMRGKLNGSVFSKNKSGNYLRTKITPVNPQTTAQQIVRGRLGTQSQSWRGLTEEQRQGWIDYAAATPYTDIFGDTKILSGQMMFNKTNLNITKCGGTAIANAPTPVGTPTLGITSLTATANSTPASSVLTAVITASGTLTNWVFVAVATPPVSAGKMYVKNLYRQISYAALTAGSKALITPYNVVFGNLIATSKVFVRLQPVNTVTGQVGVPIEIMAIATPAA